MAVREATEPGSPAVPVLQREVVALAMGLAAALLSLALYSFAPAADENLAGTLGAALADLLVQGLGLASFLPPEAYERCFVVAHDDPCVGAANVLAADARPICVHRFLFPPTSGMVHSSGNGAQ